MACNNKNIIFRVHGKVNKIPHKDVNILKQGLVFVAAAAAAAGLFDVLPMAC